MLSREHWPGSGGGVPGRNNVSRSSQEARDGLMPLRDVLAPAPTACRRLRGILSRRSLPRRSPVPAATRKRFSKSPLPLWRPRGAVPAGSSEAEAPPPAARRPPPAEGHGPRAGRHDPRWAVGRGPVGDRSSGPAAGPPPGNVSLTLFSAVVGRHLAAAFISFLLRKVAGEGIGPCCPPARPPEACFQLTAGSSWDSVCSGKLWFCYRGATCWEAPS